jgi:hypothetical protein
MPCPSRSVVFLNSPKIEVLDERLLEVLCVCGRFMPSVSSLPGTCDWHRGFLRSVFHHLLDPSSDQFVKSLDETVSFLLLYVLNF